MTEEEWLRPTAHSQWMVMSLQDRGLPRTKSGRRKLRLFACGCCRAVWDVLPDERLREAVRVAERFADRQATKDELAAAHDATEGLQGVMGPFGDRTPAVWVAIFMAASAAASRASDAAFLMTAAGMPLAGRAGGEAHLCDLLRCVFGNPFRPVTSNPAWLTSSVVELARQMYESRDFSPMPVLADALQDAGCDDADVLEHCRGEGPHVRGCHVVDVVLGKE